VKKILIEMEDQKEAYEQKAKEALQKIMEDKCLTEQQLENSQRSLAEAREDLALWKEHNAALQAELSSVSTAHSELTNSFQALQSELQVRSSLQEQLWLHSAAAGLPLGPWQRPGQAAQGWQQPGPAEGGVGRTR
uniref:Uncharacterized protein n=1 Tax=Taeniopygia guttata TaxID=59729 RepID=A0A674HPG1_TAEGU